VSQATRNRLLYAALVVLYLLHNDLWLWHDARLVFGLPAGLAYHIAFAAATSIVLTLLVIHAWPEHLDREAAHPEMETRREGRR
jgi:Protein of unknown function (DUF3311)